MVAAHGEGEGFPEGELGDDPRATKETICSLCQRGPQCHTVRLEGEARAWREAEVARANPKRSAGG